VWQDPGHWGRLSNCYAPKKCRGRTSDFTDFTAGTTPHTKLDADLGRGVSPPWPGRVSQPLSDTTAISSGTRMQPRDLHDDVPSHVALPCCLIRTLEIPSKTLLLSCPRLSNHKGASKRSLELLQQPDLETTTHTRIPIEKTLILIQRNNEGSRLAYEAFPHLPPPGNWRFPLRIVRTPLSSST